MIHCHFLLQTGNEPSKWVHLDSCNVRSAPPRGIIAPGERAAEWTEKKYGPGKPPVLLWRVVELIDYLDDNSMTVVVVPCLTYQENWPNE